VYKEIEGTGVIELNDTFVHDLSIEVLDANDNLSTLNFQVQYNDDIAEKIRRTSNGRLLIPNQVNIIEEKDFEVYMPENCLYDSIPFSYYLQDVLSPGAVTAQHKFGDRTYPIHSAFSVRIKTTKTVTADLKNKLVILKTWNGERSVRKAELKNGWVLASFDNLGIFQAFIDTIAPTINAPAKGKDTLDLSPLNSIVFYTKRQLWSKVFSCRA
jgi:hypothetical protein